MVGPHGEISLQVAIAEQWISCTTERLSIPTREWKHVAGVYRANKDQIKDPDLIYPNQIFEIPRD
jgi:hypothetical protein